MPVIEANGVHKVFGRRARAAVDRLRAGASREELRHEGVTAAVIDATFTVDAGEIFVVMGLSGSGKSTLLRMVNGLLKTTAGDLVVGGENISGLSGRALRSVRRDKVSMVFQHFALLPHRTVGENVAYALQLKGVNRVDRERRAEEALALVGLGGWGGYLPEELSGGMRQRVGLARALAADTEVLLMDEAFSALDPLIRKEMQDQLLELQQDLGKTILFITHDLNEAMRLGDRIAMMRDGRIDQVGTAAQIIDEPASDYVARFVADVDRTRVLTASAVMERTTEAGDGPRYRTDTPLLELFEPASQTTEPIVVVDRRNRVVGRLTRAQLLHAVGEGVPEEHPEVEPPSGDPTPPASSPEPAESREATR